MDLPPAAFVNFIQNHDQVANTARGERPNMVATGGKYRAITALLILMPGTPMLFQGQEFGATTPFLYFCDHKMEISKQVREGRAKFLAQFPSLSLPEMQPVFSDPGNPHTFEISKLDFSERERNAGSYQLHQDLIALRRTDPVFSNPRHSGYRWRHPRSGRVRPALFFRLARGSPTGRQSWNGPLPQSFSGTPAGASFRKIVAGDLVE